MTRPNRPRPNPHIALIYHYDLARALNGEPTDWVAIPVNVDAGREGGDLCRAAADFAKRRDLFAMPAPTNADQPARESGFEVDQAGDETSGKAQPEAAGVDSKRPDLASPADFACPCGECGGTVIDHRCTNCGTRHGDVPDDILRRPWAYDEADPRFEGKAS